MTSNDHKLLVKFDLFILPGMIEMTSEPEYIAYIFTHINTKSCYRID